ncbi:MAG: MerR family transcriptional regulator [Pseudomonadota bacterium]
MVKKTAEAFRTISEVADWLEVAPHVLRFWESKFHQFKPVKCAGGRRYYRPNDMRLLGGIKSLLHGDGLSIKEAQSLLRANGVAHVSAMSRALPGQDSETHTPKAQPAPPPAQKRPAPVTEISEDVEDARQVQDRLPFDPDEDITNIFADDDAAEDVLPPIPEDENDLADMDSLFAGTPANGAGQDQTPTPNAIDQAPAQETQPQNTADTETQSAEHVEASATQSAEPPLREVTSGAEIPPVPDFDAEALRITNIVLPPAPQDPRTRAKLRAYRKAASASEGAASRPTGADHDQLREIASRSRAFLARLERSIEG